MANVKISELTAATTLSNNDTLAVVQSATTKEASVGLVRGFTDTVAKSTGYTAVTGDSVILVSGAYTITLPAATGCSGKVLTVKNVGSTGTVTIDGNASETIDGSTTVSLSSQYDSRTIVCDGTEWHIIGSV